MTRPLLTQVRNPASGHRTQHCLPRSDHQQRLNGRTAHGALVRGFPPVR
jgi:hypothetical protein